MNLAVTNHAVERYQERVPSSAKLGAEAIRSTIRSLVEEAFERKQVREHPGFPERRMIPFTVGKEQVFLALGPNDTTFPGDWAVIGVLYEREVGKTGIGATIGDTLSDATKKSLAGVVAEVASTPTKYLVRIGGPKSKELYDAKDDDALVDLINRRDPNPDEVEIFERTTITIRRTLTIVKK
jgi:hypothetical protein